MSSQEQFMSGNGDVPPRKPNARPDCPQCKRRMTVKQVAPVLFASNLDDVIYACGRCGTEIKRTERREPI